jgi:hypothetical protein
MSDLSEVLERFRRGAELLAVATTGAAGAEVDYKPGPDKWSVRQIACHLSDAEIVNAMRFRKILAEPEPRLEAYDQNLWAEKLDYSRRRLSQAIETFRRIRAENYELLKDLPEDAFERAAIHAERGRITLLELIRLNAEHVEKHAIQIREVRSAYKQEKLKAREQKGEPTG